MPARQLFSIRPTEYRLKKNTPSIANTGMNRMIHGIAIFFQSSPGLFYSVYHRRRKDWIMDAARALHSPACCAKLGTA